MTSMPVASARPATPSFADLARLLGAVAPTGTPTPDRRALKLLRGRAAHSERRARALELRERYTSLHYDFAPTPSDPAVDVSSYDFILVAFSGGKDSLALLLLLLSMGVPRDKIELWHHEVDGAEGSTLMDWPCTPGYCQKLAEGLGVKLYRSWKVGGFEGEMTRHLAPTSGYRFEVPGGAIQAAGGKSTKVSTRQMFPQKAEDLTVRWCSAYLKIMVMDTAIRNQDRFDGARVLVLTGERGEESTGRAMYDVLAPHRADLRVGRVPRHVDHWRPVLRWPEPEVWKIIERFRVNPHPAYHLGWGRVSCAPCIFGSPDQWASLRVVNPRQFEAIAEYEARFGKTIDRERNVQEMANRGTPFPHMAERHMRAAVSREYTEPVFVDPWSLPHGALIGDGSGPT